MTDLASMTKEQLLQLVKAQQDNRPYHVHTNGKVCHSPYCTSLYDDEDPDHA
jgi:hypothetical protein